MRVLVCGDRKWADPMPMAFALIDLYLVVDSLTIVEGCAKGADQMAESLAYPFSHNPVEHHPARWKRYGRAAGPIRNQEMLDSGVDLVLAFHNNLAASKGTRDMVDRAKKAGVQVRLFNSDGELKLRRDPRGRWY